MIRPPRNCPERLAKNPTKSESETARIQEPVASGLGAPRDILGRGHRWASPSHLDPEVWAEIIRLEIGGIVSRSGS